MEETEEDIFEDDGEQTDEDLNSVTITGEESWMRNYHLMDMMPWRQDEVATSNSSHADGDMPISSLDASATGHPQLDIPEKESETGGSGEIDITQDDEANETTPRKHGTLYGTILYLDGFLPNIEIGAEVLAKDREEEG